MFLMPSSWWHPHKSGVVPPYSLVEDPPPPALNVSNRFFSRVAAPVEFGSVASVQTCRGSGLSAKT